MSKEIEFETFREIGNYEISNLKQDNPSSMDSMIRIAKYKVTVELVEESEEVYKERIQSLWDHCDNFHQWSAIQRKASEFNYTLIGDAGNKLTKKP